MLQSWSEYRWNSGLAEHHIQTLGPIHWFVFSKTRWKKKRSICFSKKMHICTPWNEKLHFFWSVKRDSYTSPPFYHPGILSCCSSFFFEAFCHKTLHVQECPCLKYLCFNIWSRAEKGLRLDFESADNFYHATSRSKLSYMAVKCSRNSLGCKLWIIYFHDCQILANNRMSIKVNVNQI